MEKAFSLKNYNDTIFSPQKYDTALSASKLYGEQEYVVNEKQDNSAFYIKLHNYYYTNPCLYNPVIMNSLSITQAQCSSLFNASFTRGVTAFMRLAYQRAQLYIYGSINLNNT